MTEFLQAILQIIIKMVESFTNVSILLLTNPAFILITGIIIGSLIISQIFLHLINKNYKYYGTKYHKFSKEEKAIDNEWKTFFKNHD